MLKKPSAVEKPMPIPLPAQLILEDQTIYHGFSFGFPRSTSGEVVFNTGMVGYPESLTDPSYSGQILVFTYPLIGNYGVPRKNSKFHPPAGGQNSNFQISKPCFESPKIQVQGLIVADYSNEYSHWQAEKSLGQWLKDEKIPAIFDIDTRALTKKLREKGVMLGKIVMAKQSRQDRHTPTSVRARDDQWYDPNKENLVAKVSIKKPHLYNQKQERKKIILVDCGMKESILRSLWKFPITIKRVPWNYDYTQEKYDGLFLSNGPGDPTHCQATIEILKKALKQNKPIFGICLGTQIMALAAGAKTYKLKYGHRGQNQPCLLLGTKRAYLTSQNHGYAIREKTLPADWQVWFRNANDGTIEGIRHKSKPLAGVQFHPEASPGPTDTNWLFRAFENSLRSSRNCHARERPALDLIGDGNPTSTELSLFSGFPLSRE